MDETRNIAKSYDPKQVEEKLYNRSVENGYFTPIIDKIKNTLYYCDATTKYYRTASYGSCT